MRCSPVYCHCRGVAPFEGVGIVIWWIVEEIINNKDTWWQIQIDSLATVLTEWAVVFLVFIGLNWWMGPRVIYEPTNPVQRKILGMIFKLTPRSPPPTPPAVYTPKVHAHPLPVLLVCMTASMHYAG